MIKDLFYKWLAKKFVPAWTKDMEEEGILQHVMGHDINEVPESEYILVEDNRADVTIFVFSGLDGLFAAGPRFEFKSIFAKLGQGYNGVCIRELGGMFYHVAPNGVVDGLEFYERKISDLMKRLGARHNISIGFSAGGTAAYYFGSRCGMDKIIGFGPAFPITVYTSGLNILRSLLNASLATRSFAAYCEILAVTIWGRISQHRLGKVLNGKPQWDVFAAYRDAPKGRPLGTIIYGVHSLPDARQAALMRQFDEIKLLPIDTGFHNVPGELKKRGELGTVLLNELNEYLSAHETYVTPLAANQR